MRSAAQQEWSNLKDEVSKAFQVQWVTCMSGGGRAVLGEVSCCVAAWVGFGAGNIC